MKTSMENIETIIRNKLAAEFRFFKVSNVSVRKDSDADGDPILLVDVVFKGNLVDVDTKILSSAVRIVRPELLANNEAAFPVFSFISEHDAGQLKREAARSH
jgi:hypothetical protein